MSEAQTILKMIEEVSPGDTAKLDEIDARVSIYLDKSDPDSLCWLGNEEKPAWRGRIWEGCDEYTRSRDSLKRIRPEGWDILVISLTMWQMGKGLSDQHWNEYEVSTTPVECPTEELAELHAIIQAIAYERGKA